MQRNDRRSQGLDHKEVFYCKRIKDSVNCNYFNITDEKTVCNPEESVRFYLKIGGIVFAQLKRVKGRKKSSCAQRFKDSNCFGSYLYYCGSDSKLRCITYCRRKGLPESKLVSEPGLLHSVIPRYHESNGNVIIGMRIDNLHTSERLWKRCDNPQRSKLHKGFHEIDSTLNLRSFNDDMDLRRANMTIAFYVTENTSLLMIDETRMHMYNEIGCRHFMYTLFQSGAVVFANCNFNFKFYDIEESEKFSTEQLYYKFNDLMPETVGIENFRRTLNMRTPVVFLKSAPNHTFWTLRVTKVIGIDGTRVVQLGIPTGGQFESVYPQSEGIEEVIRRQSLQPWNKYIQLEGSANFENINMNVNEAYPQINL